MKKSLEMCVGCEDDFYNDKNPLGVKRCWSFKDATIVARWATDTWALPTTPGAFRQVVILDCRRQKGEHYRETLPALAVDPVLLDDSAFLDAFEARGPKEPA